MSNKKPILVLLAAGMGSRYGGLKQIDPVGPNNEILMEYSLYDAKKAGFERIVFIIKSQDEKAFREAIGDKIEEHFEVNYAFQELDDIPEAYSIPEGRVKPWGTAHAVLSAREIIDAPFAVINADDYYGKEAFKLVYNFLVAEPNEKEALMVSYILGNTLSENGHVARGICQIDEAGKLEHIVERRMIRPAGKTAEFSLDQGESWEPVPLESQVSMNFWGFSESMIAQISKYFPAFFEEDVPKNLMKSEYLLPELVGELIKNGDMSVSCQSSHDQWYGVTYREDKESVMRAIQAMINKGDYPQLLWEE